MLRCVFCRELRTPAEKERPGKLGKFKGSSSLEDLTATPNISDTATPTSPTRKGKDKRRMKKTPSFSTRRKTTSFNVSD